MTTRNAKLKRDSNCQVGKTCVVWDTGYRKLKESGMNTSEMYFCDQCKQRNNESNCCPTLCNPANGIRAKCISGPSGEAADNKPKCQPALIGSKFSKCQCNSRNGLQHSCDGSENKNQKQENKNCRCGFHCNTLPSYQPPYCCYNNEVPPMCCCGNTLLAKSCSCDSPEQPDVEEKHPSSSPEESKPKPYCGARCTDPGRGTRCVGPGSPVAIGQVVPLAPSPPYPLCSPPPLAFAHDTDRDCMVEMYGDPICCCNCR